MKNLKSLALTFTLLVFAANVNAQDDNNPWQISVGINAVDVYPVGEASPQGDFFDEFYNVTGHWNYVTGPSTISISKYLTDNFSFGVSGSFNVIEKWGSDYATNETISVDELKYYALDGTSNSFKHFFTIYCFVRYKLKNISAFSLKGPSENAKQEYELFDLKSEAS